MRYSYPCGFHVYTNPFLYGLTISPNQDGCLSLGRHILTEISTILRSMDRVEYCTFGSNFYGVLDKGVGKSIFLRGTGGTGHGIYV